MEPIWRERKRTVFGRDKKRVMTREIMDDSDDEEDS